MKKWIPAITTHLQRNWNVSSVHIVATALALRLQHVLFGIGQRQLDGSLALLVHVQRVEPREDLEHGRNLFVIVDESFEGLTAGQCLLHLLRARQMVLDRRTLDGLALLDQKTRLPLFVPEVVTGLVAGTEINHRHFDAIT